MKTKLIITIIVGLGLSQLALGLSMHLSKDALLITKSAHDNGMHNTAVLEALAQELDYTKYENLINQTLSRKQVNLQALATNLAITEYLSQQLWQALYDDLTKQPWESKQKTLLNYLGFTTSASASIPTVPAAAPLPAAASIHVQHQYGWAEMQGHRTSMEDAHTMITGPEIDFFGVFDGHSGKEVADYVAEHLYGNILSEPSFAANPAQAIRDGCLKTDVNIQTDQKMIDLRKWGMDPGSTAIFALIQGENMYIGNIGDARAVLSSGGVAMALSQDQKPNRPDEKARIEAAGGSVTFWGVWRVQGNLAVARAFGDLDLKQYVPADPEILTHKIVPADEFLILGCDGVWDVLNNQEAVDIVKTSLTETGGDLNVAAKKLIDEAFAKGSRDNISAIVVKLN